MCLFVPPLDTNLALCLSMLPLALYLSLNTHLQPMILTTFGGSTKSHVFFLSKTSNFVLIAIVQFESFRACFKVDGSKKLLLFCDTMHIAPVVILCVGTTKVPGIESEELVEANDPEEATIDGDGSRTGSWIDGEDSRTKSWGQVRGVKMHWLVSDGREIRVEEKESLSEFSGDTLVFNWDRGYIDSSKITCGEHKLD